MTDFNNRPMPGASLTARLSRWWKTQSAQRRQQLFSRCALGAVCFGVLAIGMPVLADINSERQDAETFRERSEQLAEIAQDDGEIVQAVEQAPALLHHEWLKAVEYSLERDPAAALSRYTAYERDNAAISSLITFEVPKRTHAEDMMRQTQCLATAIYYEARSEKTSGQLAVAEVIVNRANDHRYPNTICDVVFQGSTRTTGCQFTFTCDGAMDKKPRGKRWDKAQSIASHVVMGLNEDKTAGATHYHATYVDPVWNSGLVKTEKIGTHIFYRFPRGSEWSVASARQNKRLAQRRSGMKAITPAKAVIAETAKVLKPAPAVEAEMPVITLAAADLNAQSLAATKANAAKAEPAAQPVVTRRIVRRVVNGVVVEEREVPGTSLDAMGG